MPRPLKIVAAVVLVLILVSGSIVAWRVIRRQEMTPEGIALLTPVPNAAGFEPTDRPRAPVLHATTTPDTLRVDFGYAVGGTPYTYSLALNFPAGAQDGRATMSVRHDGHEGSTDSEAVRRWDAPRKAYAVALSDKFMVSPRVPSLCVKAVVGPDLARWDLADATLCVAQRDAGGACHPETLACGLLR